MYPAHRLRALQSIKSLPSRGSSPSARCFQYVRYSSSRAKPSSLVKPTSLVALAGAGLASLWLWFPSLKNAANHGQLPHIHYASAEQINEAIEEIRRLLPDDDSIISVDSEDLQAHGYSDCSSPDVNTLPDAVIYPRTTEDVSVVARICHRKRIPIIPYSGGSSLEGHTSAAKGGFSIDFVHMDRVIALDDADLNVTVQPGLGWVDMNAWLRKEGHQLFFPIDPDTASLFQYCPGLTITGPTAKFGGMIATNCSGTNAVRYGTMRDWVVNLTVVLADGTVIKTRRRPRKCSAGYNLNGLIVGSEGTLGIVTEATLKLAVVPEHTSVAVVPFPDIRTAVAAATEVIRSGVQVAALELMDGALMRMINKSGATGPRSWREVPTLFFKFSGSTASVSADIDKVKEITSRKGSGGFEFASDEREEQLLWSARKESLYSILALREDGEDLWNTDVAVPISRLADIIEASHEDAQSLGLDVYIKGHVGDGNFHENIRYRKDQRESLEKATFAVKNMVARALEMDGTCTGEHGIGSGKKDALRDEVGEHTLMTMKLIKSTLDPHWILNPGKVFDF